MYLVSAYVAVHAARTDAPLELDAEGLEASDAAKARIAAEEQRPREVEGVLDAMASVAQLAVSLATRKAAGVEQEFVDEGVREILIVMHWT